jgi:hypothetical protein
MMALFAGSGGSSQVVITYPFQVSTDGSTAGFLGDGGETAGSVVNGDLPNEIKVNFGDSVSITIEIPDPPNGITRVSDDLPACGQIIPLDA